MGTYTLLVTDGASDVFYMNMHFDLREASLPVVQCRVFDLMESGYRVLRVRLPAIPGSTTQNYLIPTVNGFLAIERRVPIT